MRSAIYARKSTDQSGVSDEMRSVARQVEVAKAFAARHGWDVLEEYVFIDDGISGAEFDRRPAFLRLMRCLGLRAPFDVLIMSEASRLGREALETNHAFKQLLSAGVRVFFALENRELLLDSPADKLVLTMSGIVAEYERENARARTKEAMLRKARAGHVTGGRVYGYANREVFETNCASERPKRVRVDYEIKPDEAAIIVRIFRWAADGLGLKRIAVTLNDEHVPGPAPYRPGRPRGWAPSTILAMLERELYRGVIVYNRTKKRDSWGRKRQTSRPMDDWVRVDAPQLRIISDELWQAVRQRRAKARTIYLKSTGGRTWGHPVNGIESPYLLTGMAACGVCQGSLHVRSRRSAQNRLFVYGCMTHHLRGKAVCANSSVIPMALVDDAVLAAINRDVLAPVVVRRAIRMTFALIAPLQTALDERRDRLQAGIDKLENELERLLDVIVSGGGGASPTLAKAVREREEQRARLQADLQALGNHPECDIDAAATRREIFGRLRNWQAVAKRHLPEARQLLREVLADRLVFTPAILDKATQWEFRGPASLGRLIEGILPKGVVAPTGFEPVFQP